MGSTKKNTSKSKAGTQSAERAAAPDIELKVADDVAAQPGETCPAEEAPSTEPAASQEVANPEATCGEAELFSVAEVPAEKSAPTPNLSLHASAIPLSLRPEMSIDWPHSRKRQLFNVVYFGLITLQLWGLAYTTDFHWAGLIGSFVCGLLASASVFYLFNHRHHQSSSDEFSPRVRRSLRAAALLVPAFLMFAMLKGQHPRIYPTQIEAPPIISGVSPAFNSEMALGINAYKRNQYDLAFQHFQTAEGIDPNSDLAEQWIARTHESVRNFPEALRYGMNAIALNPDNEDAHDVAAHAQNVMGNYEEGLKLATRATQLEPEDGEAWGLMSRSYSGLGQYEKALPADNNHVRYHSYESDAFRQRAQTLDHLGRSAEARYDRNMAKTIYDTTGR